MISQIPELQIGDITVKVPIIQGGMGVRVSLASLSAAVANEGAVGTISSIGLGDIEASKSDYLGESINALQREIRKARNLTEGHLAVNFMGVLSHVDDLILTAIQEGIRIIIYGAGIPTRLPELAEEGEVNFVPIVSSARVGDIILRSWERRYNRIPEALILEGPLAGGHLGFSQEQLDDLDHYSLENLLGQLLETVAPFEERFGRKIPIITAGGIYTGADIARILALGASGVQMATRFVCTFECDVSDEFKQAYLDAREEDIVIIRSPVGLLGRAINNPFLKRIEDEDGGKIPCFYRCLTACKVEDAKYCIALALLNAYRGNLEDGLIFCGTNAYRIDRIVSVKDLISELLTEMQAA